MTISVFDYILIFCLEILIFDFFKVKIDYFVKEQLVREKNHDAVEDKNKMYFFI
jgi:hypothetical protein